MFCTPTSRYSSVMLMSSGSTIAYSFLGTRSSPSCLENKLQTFGRKVAFKECTKNVSTTVSGDVIKSDQPHTPPICVYHDLFLQLE